MGLLGAIIGENVLNTLSGYNPTIDSSVQQASHWKDGKYYTDTGDGTMDEVPSPFFKTNDDGSYAKAAGPYNEPSTWQKLISTRANKYSDINAQDQASLFNAATAENAKMLTPSYAGTQHYAQGLDQNNNQFNTGALVGQTGLATANTGLSAAQSAQARQPTINATSDANANSALFAAQNITPTEYQAAAIKAAGDLGREPKQQEILNTALATRKLQTDAENKAAPYNASSLVGQAQFGANATSGALARQPLDENARMSEAVSEAYAAQHPHISSPTVFDATVDPNAGTIVPGRINPNQTLLSNVSNGLGQSSDPTTVSIGGKSVAIPPDPAQQSGDDSNAVDPLHKHAMDLHKAKGDADAAGIKARKAAIDAEAKQQSLNHLIGTTHLIDPSNAQDIINNYVRPRAILYKASQEDEDYYKKQMSPLIGRSSMGPNTY